MKNLKLISTILLSVIISFVITSSVFAADADNGTTNSDIFNVESETSNNDIWGTPEGVNSENVDNTPISVNTTPIEENESGNESFVYNEENDTTSNSENLAYTGIGDSNGIIALIVIISALVAIYSAKKFNDYKNI